MAGIKEPGIFIVDDVTFVHPEHGFAIGAELEKRKIKKEYYMETRPMCCAATARCSRTGKNSG